MTYIVRIASDRRNKTMNNQKIISKFGEINNISHTVINELSVSRVTDNEVLEQTELIENKLIEIRLAIAEV
jgi:hypothetical protein